jgi:hypothetical protein
MLSENPRPDKPEVPSAETVLTDPAASVWLRAALRSALVRDPVDAANDAEVLARVLDARCRSILGQPNS